MSRITNLVTDMRKRAVFYKRSTTKRMLLDAANVIENLSKKLQRANMERSIAHYNSGWIPVGERLPEVSFSFRDIGADGVYEAFESVRVLVSYIPHRKNNIEICAARYYEWIHENSEDCKGWESAAFDYEGDALYKTNIDCDVIDAGEPEGGTVIAWMPLPDPYVPDTDVGKKERK